MNIRIRTRAVALNGKMLIEDGEVSFAENGINLISAPNGKGKTLYLNRLFEAFRGRAVYVSQDNRMFSDQLSTGENISLSEDVSVNEQCERFMEDIGLLRLISRNPSTLSGGEKRMLCIARGLFYCSGGILLLDEPTNDLDNDHVILLKQLLVESRHGVTIILVSHDDRMREIADRCFVIREKQIICCAEKEGAFYVCTKSRGRRNVDPKTYVKTLPGRWVTGCFVGLFMLICLYFTYWGIAPDPADYPDVPPETVLVFTPDSTLGAEYLSGGAIPAKAVEALGTSKNMSSRLKILKNAVDSQKYDEITYLPEIRETECASVFPIEYYIPGKSEYRSLENYSDRGFKKMLSEGGAYESSNLLQKELREEKNRVISGLMLRFHKGADLFEVMSEPNVSALAGTNCYVISAETVAMARQLKAFERRMTAMTSAAELMAVLFAVYVILLGILLYRGRVSQLMFRNVGLKKRTQINWIIKVYDYSILKWAAMAGAVAAACAMQFGMGSAAGIANLAVPAVMVAALFGMSVSCRALARLSQSRVYSWRMR